MRLASLGPWALFFVTLAAPVARAADQSSTLFRYNGKSFTSKDLPIGEQQQIFDLENEAHLRLETILEGAALNAYFDDEAKKAGKPRAEIETKLLAVPDPTDDAVKKFYEENKARIPPGYTLDKVTPEIRNALREQARKEKRDELVQSLKTSGKLSLSLPEPTAPKVKLETAGMPVKGSAAATVTIVEFADYQCPHCRAAQPVLDAVLKKYDGKVKLVFIDFPIKGERSEQAAQGAYCAEKQGKYWEFHDLVFDKQADLHGADDALAKLAKQAGLDDAAFKTCLPTPEAKARVAKGKAEGERIGLTGTPTIYINGRRVRGYEQPELEKEVERALKAGQS